MPDDAQVEERLTGGNVSVVVRVGDTVRRPAQPWTPAVHRLLDHLETVGFTHAPRAHGLDDAGREILDYLPGRMGGFPYDPWLLTDAGLDAVIGSIRAFHDATAGSPLLDESGWQAMVPDDLPREVICHGDLAPYNLVLRDGRGDYDDPSDIAGWIDFDTACPGPRLWDLAYAAYTFVPLYTEGHDLPDDLDRAARLTRFAETAAVERGELLAMIDCRLSTHITWLEDGAASGDPARVRMRAEGHAAMYRRERIALDGWR